MREIRQKKGEGVAGGGRFSERRDAFGEPRPFEQSRSTPCARHLFVSVGRKLLFYESFKTFRHVQLACKVWMIGDDTIKLIL
jgi:hypothetical protein